MNEHEYIQALLDRLAHLRQSQSTIEQLYKDERDAILRHQYVSCLRVSIKRMGYTLAG